MKILYGVQATGNGHICRSREVVAELKALGHHIDVVFSGRPPSAFKDIETFEPYRIYRGLTFHTFRGKLRFWRTCLGLNLFRFYRDIRAFDASGYDLVITDFEPLTARIARRHRLPSIGIGHQYAFLYNVPLWGADPISLRILKNFAPVDIPLGLHWHHFNQSILPPVIPSYLASKGHVVSNKILVYLPFEEPEDVIDRLCGLRKYQFFIYGDKHRPGVLGNLHLNTFSRSGFLKDLVECEGVIANAGFELPSEAVHLGKKLLVKPLLGQMEQLSNARAISELELGMMMDRLDRSKIEQWLNTPLNRSIRFPDVATEIASYVNDGCREDVDRFTRRVWQKVHQG